MPGPIVHLIVQQRLAGRLRRREIELNRPPTLADLLAKDQCSPYAGFGSMGPDFLFFSTREYGSAIGDLTNYIFKAYDALEPFIDFYEDHIEPVIDAAEDAITAVDQALFNGIFTDLSNLSAALSTTAITAVGSVVTSHVDLFYGFRPKIQEGAAEKDWYWFDFLHYRRTGQFCSRMWQLAEQANDDDLRRYVLGYTSHIGTDVVGHPFVNSVVGGPYRMHSKRHKLVENWIDAYARNVFPDGPKTKGCLNLTGDDTYVANAINGSYYYRLCAFPDEKLPPKLGEMMLKAMADVYGGMAHPPDFSFDDLDDTYRLWLMWFRRATSFGSMHPPTPVPPPGSAAAALVSDYVGGLPSFPGGGSGGGGGGGFSILDIFAAIVGFVEWLGELVKYTIDWIITHVVDIFLLPITEALALLKWLIYQIHKGLYQIYDNLRWTLVLGGYFFPEPQDLSKEPWRRALLNTSFTALTGGGSANFCFYPRKQVDHDLTSTEHHLVFPTTPAELPYAEPMPKELYGTFPEQFIAGSFPFDPAIKSLYEAKGPYNLAFYGDPAKPANCASPTSATFDWTHELDAATWNTPQFGSAIDFSARLIATRLEKLPNFNLDGDRGYAWQTWRAKDPADIELNNPVPVEETYDLS
jgi:hypothetical protein